MIRKDVHPKRKERNQPLTSKTLLKPSKNKKIDFPSLTRCRLSTLPQPLKDTQSLDILVTCVHSDVLLPLPTLRKHEMSSETLDLASYMLRAVLTESLPTSTLPGVPVPISRFHSFLKCWPEAHSHSKVWDLLIPLTFYAHIYTTKTYCL